VFNGFGVFVTKSRNQGTTLLAAYIATGSLRT
jgi:hypothetical protein